MMSPRVKFALQVLAFAVVASTIGFILFYIFFKPEAELIKEEIESELEAGILTPSLDREEDIIVSEDITEPTGLTPSAIARGDVTLTTRLTTSSVVSPSIIGNSIGYYDPNDGRFYSIDADGRVLPISDAKFLGAESVLFSQDAESAILEFPDGSNILYNLDEGRQITMPSHWEDFGFSPQGDELIGKAIADPNNGQLVVMNTNGTQARSVAELGPNEGKVDVMWSPNGEFLALSNTGQAQAGFGRRAVLLIDQNGDAPGSIIVDGTNFSAKWTPLGQHLVYSTSNPANRERPSLWYVKATGDEIGEERKDLGVATWIEKCAFRDDTFLICAVPKTIPDFQGYDYRLSESADDVYEINLLTGRSTLLAEPVVDVTMTNLSVSADQTTLYFTDEFNRLNTLRLR